MPALAPPPIGGHAIQPRHGPLGGHTAALIRDKIDSSPRTATTNHPRSRHHANQPHSTRSSHRNRPRSRRTRPGNRSDRQRRHQAHPPLDGSHAHHHNHPQPHSASHTANHTT